MSLKNSKAAGVAQPSITQQVANLQSFLAVPVTEAIETLEEGAKQLDLMSSMAKDKAAELRAKARTMRASL